MFLGVLIVKHVCLLAKLLVESDFEVHISHTFALDYFILNVLLVIICSVRASIVVEHGKLTLVPPRYLAMRAIAA